MNPKGLKKIFWKCELCNEGGVDDGRNDLRTNIVLPIEDCPNTVPLGKHKYVPKYGQDVMDLLNRNGSDTSKIFTGQEHSTVTGAGDGGRAAIVHSFDLSRRFFAKDETGELKISKEQYEYLVSNGATVTNIDLSS